MASLKLFIFAAVVACVFAAQEDERVKKDVLLGTYPYAYSALPYAYTALDTKSVIAPAVTAYHHPAAAVVPAVSSYSAAMPVSAYSAYPYSAYPYSAYPHSAYPYAKTIVY